LSKQTSNSFTAVRISRGASYLIAQTVVSNAVLVVSFAILARLITPKEMGIWAIRLENLKREPNATSVQLVKSMNLTIRSLNESVFRKFKARAVEEGMKLGEALTQAMHIWIKQSTNKPEGSLLDLETFDWGKGTEKISAKIDEIMYG